MPFPNEHACRVRDPGDFQEGSFRRITEGDLDIIIGRPEGQDTTATQAFRYPIGEWTEERAREHCAENDGSFEAAEPEKAMGNALKALRETDDTLTVANYIVLFGGRDLEGIASDYKNVDGSTGQFFTNDTTLESDYTATGRLFVDWEHGYGDEGEPQRDNVLGFVDWKSARVDDNGVWVERVLNRRSQYMQYLESLIKQGLIGNSSEAVPNSVEVGEDGEIKAWPLKRDTLTVTPMEPRMMNENVLTALKALGITPDDKPEAQPEAAKAAAGAVESEGVDATTGGPLGSAVSVTLGDGMNDSVESHYDSTVTITEVNIMPDGNEQANPEVATVKAPQIDYALLAAALEDERANREKANPRPAKSAGFVTEDELDRKSQDPALQPYRSVGEQLQDVAKAASGGKPKPRLLAAHKKAAKAISGMNETIGSEGGFLVQTDFVEELMTPMYGEGEVLSRITGKLQTSSRANSVEIPVIKETTRANDVIMGGVRAYRRSEGNSVTNTQPTIDLLTLKLNAMDVLMYATDELLQDSALLTSTVLSDVPTALIVKTEGEVFNGTGAGEMRGIIGNGGTVTVAKETGQTAATVVAENILNMWKVALPGPIDYAWYCTRVMAAELQQMDKAVGTGGELVYMPPGGLSVHPYATLMGDPVVIVPYTSALGTVGDIIYGAMSRYRYIDKGSILAAQSMHVRFIQSEMTFKWTLRNDGQPKSSNTVTSYNSEISQGYFVELATRA